MDLHFAAVASLAILLKKWAALRAGNTTTSAWDGVSSSDIAGALGSMESPSAHAACSQYAAAAQANTTTVTTTVLVTHAAEDPAFLANILMYFESEAAFAVLSLLVIFVSLPGAVWCRRLMVGC